MTLKTSEFPFDMVFAKDGNHITIDKNEPNKTNYTNLITVDENKAIILPDYEKDFLKICEETTKVFK